MFKSGSAVVIGGQQRIYKVGNHFEDHSTEVMLVDSKQLSRHHGCALRNSQIQSITLISWDEGGFSGNYSFWFTAKCLSEN